MNTIWGKKNCSFLPQTGVKMWGKNEHKDFCKTNNFSEKLL